eukprot:COSAG04_NODE_142_length_23587_cov_115.049295_7_plen_154_part_00
MCARPARLILLCILACGFPTEFYDADRDELRDNAGRDFRRVAVGVELACLTARVTEGGAYDVFDNQILLGAGSDYFAQRNWTTILAASALAYEVLLAADQWCDTICADDVSEIGMSDLGRKGATTQCSSCRRQRRTAACTRSHTSTRPRSGGG